ncbi:MULTISPECIES: hypothetical protein [Bacillaceae]|uniref:hypothetical protein n=1 Tax=Bacillaceae TaxID=186817 RepID=UPI000BFBC1EA|nr:MULTISPECIES: hypothetical protein [Bacillaceae]PGT84640.1 hypothetical protein COD11_10480 [Bacillus sp. AFS040349]UGB33676.1 hypothetical protein LPC09_25820 [Metabacillus sp. B2-18]
MSKNEEFQLIGAAKLMEDLFLNGIYQRRKSSKEFLDQLKHTMRKTFSNYETRRNEFHGIVAKFVRDPIYKTDTISFKGLLNDIGILHKVVKLNYSFIKDDEDLVDLLADYSYPKEFFAQIYLNKKGKNEVDKREFLFDTSLEGIAELFKSEKRNIDRLEEKYRNTLLDIEKCPMLKQAGTLKCNYGTIKLREKDVVYDVESIFKEFGSHFLLEYGQISMEKVEEYIIKGFLSYKEIEKYRKLVDIPLKFFVMDIETERKSMETYQYISMQKAQAKRYA